MTYKWKEGFRANVKADVAGTVCAELEKKGTLTAESLVNVSRPAEAPLHRYFEWNDEKAAELYRKKQAMTLIRAIEVVTEDEPTKTRTVFFNIKSMGPQYEKLETILVNEDKKAALLDQAKRDMQIFRAKYYELVELAKVMSAIDENLAG